MVKKKSIASKIKARRNAYQRSKVTKRIRHLWGVLFFTMKALRIFLRHKRNVSVFDNIQDNNNNIFDKQQIFHNHVNIVENNLALTSINKIETEETESLNSIEHLLNRMVARVTRLDSERKRQWNLRQRKKILRSSDRSTENFERNINKRKWFRNKYKCDSLFRKRRIASVRKYFKNNNNNLHFHNQYKSRMKKYFSNKIQNDKIFHERHKSRMKKYFSNKIQNDKNFHELHRLRTKKYFLSKIRSDQNFRERQRIRVKNYFLNKIQNDKNFLNRHRLRMKLYYLYKYYNNRTFYEKQKINMKNYSSTIYGSDIGKRMKKIQTVLNHYYRNYSLIEQYKRRNYNKDRRLSKKRLIGNKNSCEMRHRQIYLNFLDLFRKLSSEGPDYVCIICQLALFRSQVVPYVERKCINEAMPQEITERIKSCISKRSLCKKDWICRWCSFKLKKGEVPNRALINKLQVSKIPIELKKLNNLEQHLIALRLPFMKIVNLTSGKISNRFSQKGTIGPLHCVPSDVQETVTHLPRPIDRSMMIRLQLKRRINYKTVWEEQLINPNDIRNALGFLKEHHPDYKNIEIDEITEDYILSDKVENISQDNETLIKTTDSLKDTMNDAFEDIGKNSEEHLKRLALGDVKNDIPSDNEDEIFEDYNDNRTKYNNGTDCCSQPCDINDYVVLIKDQYMIAPAEKNKLCSLLNDNSIEKLAFPHLFPNGRGTFEEEREIKLYWKDYCKARLFSSDDRFASDSTYIFFLQYLSDLRQAFSGINIKFRKKIPLTAKESLDDTHMKFLMGNDMIYRYLQTVRGSPQFWNQRLKELFGMTRQIGYPTFFFTLTSADLRWKEFTDVFARNSEKKIKDLYSFEEKSKILRANPVLAARMFERRLNIFMNLFIKGNASCLGEVEDWFYRIEMQMRGSPHAHMPLWIKDAPKYKGLDTDEKTRENIVMFCDKYITTHFPDRLEDPELYDIVKEVQMHSRSHSKACLKFHKTICRFGFPRPVSRRTFICEPLKIETEEDEQLKKRAKTVLTEMNIVMNDIEKERKLTWLDFETILGKYNWTYDDYERSLKLIHNRALIIHKRDPNARWINQYNKEILRTWNANIDIQFILNPYACAKYLMSYTTKPEREMSLLLEETHKECREGNMTVREEMKKLTGTFFNHRQISVQEAVYRATKMPLTNSSLGFIFVPSHSNSCRFLKSKYELERMDPDDNNIYMSNLTDKYFDRPLDETFDICLADFASTYEIVPITKKIRNPKTPIKKLQTLNFGVKKRCGRNAIIRYPYFNREKDIEDHYENLLSLYLPIRKREELKKPYKLFYEKGEIFDIEHKCSRKVKDVVNENRKKYEAHFEASQEIELIYNDLSSNTKADEWSEIVANKEKDCLWRENIEQEENPDFDMLRKKKDSSIILDMKQVYTTTNEIKPLLETMNVEQQEVFYYVRNWCLRRVNDRDIEPLRLFITGGAGTGKSHLLKCLHYEATRIFSQKKYLEPDETINEIHTLITAFTGAAAVNVGGITIHSAFGINSTRDRVCDNLSCSKLNSYRCKLGSLKLLFVDEVSLIQASLWGAMHSRLTQIMGINSNSAVFGNVGIIALGDFYQCSPVASTGIYSTLLWSDLFEYTELKINERQKNASFSKMLNRIRILKRKEEMLEEDKFTLTKCHQRFLNNEYHPQALHVFAKDTEVDAHNEKIIDKICNDIRTFYEIDSYGKEIKINDSKQRKIIHKRLRLAINARVMITKNISVADGLANGVMGYVVGYIENVENKVSHILIKCDSKLAGRLHRNICSYCKGKDTICVTRESGIIEGDDSDLLRRSSTKQFPLRLSWAITVHKAQGLTVDEIVISTKDCFGSGMGYTALSRTRKCEGLFLSDLHLKKFYCDEYIDKILSSMKPMKITKTIFQEDSQILNVLFHNVEGLNSNFSALRNYYLTKKADIICLAETWLTDNHDINNYQIEGYNFYYRTRASSFKPDHPFHRRKGGGVCIYYRNQFQIKQIHYSSVLNFEHVCVELEKENIIILTCYRSPQLEKILFLHELTSFLKNINKEKRILIIGDLNEDSFQSNSKTIESYMYNLGFSNLFKNASTTNNFTSLDCAYSNFLSEKNVFKEVMGIYFSFHEALTLSFSIKQEKIHLSNESDKNHNNDVEPDTAKNLSVSVSKNASKAYKRKQNFKNIGIINKKKKHASCSFVSEINYISMEKQISFLHNITKNIEGNCLQKENSTITLNEQLHRLNLKSINVLGDGNCFFRAISHQLYRNEYNHMEIRSMAIFYIKSRKDVFFSFIDETDSSIESYIDRMKKNGTYADFLIILATAVTINKNIIVHELYKKPILIPGSDYIDNQMHVSYDPFSLHYKSVICIDGSQGSVDIEELQLI